MFIELHVENLALIESADLTWQPGLNVLTGETGAGKSMVIDAVSLLLGGRSSQEYIRDGAETCLVQGIFSGPYPAAVLQKLTEFGIITAEEAEKDRFQEDLFLSRELQRSGRNVCRINLRQVPLTVFREISRNLINIHGQMEHVILLEAENQRFLLDSFGGQTHQEALQKTKNAYVLWQEKQHDWQEIQKQAERQEERQEMLQSQQKELEEAQLDITEEQELQGEYKRLEHAQELAEYANEAWRLLNGGQFSPLAAVAQSLAAVQRLAALDETLQPLSERLNDIYYNLEDISLELRDCKDRMLEDPERLEAVQERLHQLKSLSKKYGGDVAYLIALKEKMQEELILWENRDLLLQEKAAEAQKAAAVYEAAAENLHQERLLTAERLSLAITAELQQLQMSQAKFQVVLEKSAVKAEGFDQVVFMIQPNLGEGLLPVAKIASGGEMSRMMLAIKVILAKLDQVPTLIFDEIDTGLGGIALVSVAEKLKQISKYTQVICVTHAPVLAAYADHNLYVEKLQEEERTITTVRILNETEKLSEICRMLAGKYVTENTKRQAEELIALGKQI